MPPGAQRGSPAIEVTALGDAPQWPVKIWTDHPGIRWEALEDKGKFKVVVDAEVDAGVHYVRFYDDENATDALRFVVGCATESVEKEPNDSVAKAQLLSHLPHTVSGVLEKRAEVDTFAIDLKEGDMLFALVDARESLRSPLDACLQIVSQRGTVLAQNLDAIGLDPLKSFVAPRTERYYVRVFGFPETPNSTIDFGGGDSFVYRLSLTSGGWARATQPLAISSSVDTDLQLIGANLSETMRFIGVPATPLKYRKGLSDWPVDREGILSSLRLPVFKIPLVIEQIPSADKPLQQLPVPSSITGRLDQAKQVDRFSFQASKGTKLRFSLHSRSFGFPMDGVLRILDSEGKQLAREDDSGKNADCTLVWQPPTDGEFTLAVSDVFSAGGEWFYYRVDIEQVQSDVRLSVKSDRFQAKLGQASDIAVNIERRDGFVQPLQLSVEGLPESVTCPTVVSEKDGTTAKEVTLKVTAASAFRGPIRIVAKQEGQADFVRIAETADGFQDLWLTAR